jgi:PGF-pre-PGF domain-containing protein
MVWQPPNRVIIPVIFILLLCALVSTARADSVTPPGSITICGYVTYANEIGIWWFNPYDPDFGGVQMWLDNGYLGTTAPADHFYNAYSDVVGPHTFSTHTFDNSSNVNTTWVNLTFSTKEYPGCTENWTCDTCSRPIAPVAAFSANQTSGIVPLAVLFTDNSTNTPTAWNWSFGDGNFSALQNPEYTFTRAGSYSITLNASNIAGYNSTTKVDYINVIPQSPVASFTSNVTEGLAPLSVQFNDTSANFPTMWNWSFGDTLWFNTTDSSLRNATKSYTSGGNYTITLYVSNSGGSDNVSHSIDVWNRTTNDFVANVTSGNVTFPVLFNDTSFNATSWFWIFDGINTSTSQNPLFEYAVPGIYSVNHSSSNAHDTFWTNKSNYITAYNPFVPGATANFTQNVTQGLTPLIVLFNDTSTGTPTFWNWSFGDGTFSDTQNVTKTYSTGGYYEINLTVWNANTTRSSKLGYVDVWNRTTNDFVANVTSGNVTFPVQFNETSYNATSWFWIFDGINTSTSQNPVFEYAVPGIYSVNHSSSNAHDTFWTNKSNYITAYPPGVLAPVAGFTGTPASGTAPLTVQFTDQSTGSPTSRNWSFGDGNFSTLQSPAHTYAFAGTFTVSLTATNSAGSNLSTRSNYITVTSIIIPPTASFIGTPTAGTAPLTVQFTDQSTGSPTSWNWSFGDGSYSTAQNPSHTYSVNGTYTVSLNVTNAAGSNTAIRANYITVSNIPPVTPTSPSTDSDTPRFVPTTGAATETGAKAGERITLPFAGNLEADDSVPVVVVAISLVPSIDIQGVMVSAITAPVGRATKIPGNPPAYYLDITINWIREEFVREADIRFSVDDGWLKEQGIAPTDLVMTRYHDTTWSELPTRMEKYSNGRYYYSATTSGFPYFAVTRKGTGVRTTTPTLISLVTITQQIKTESTTITTTRPVTPIPVRTKPLTTTTTVPPVSYPESPEFPTLWIVFGVAGFTGVILIIVVIRRWWIRRQNPALFRKYD